MTDTPVKAAFEAECKRPKKRTRKLTDNSYDDEEADKSFPNIAAYLGVCSRVSDLSLS